MNASSRTIFALGSGCDGIEETCNWLKEEEREKKHIWSEGSLTLVCARTTTHSIFGISFMSASH